jgi:nitrite reductase (cytochrome c-552)
MLKAQHPGYEVYKMGIHGLRGVSCADCHMPYKTEGGQKFTDHHIQSPLNNVANSCQVCHREEKEELIRSVFSNQDKIIENRDQLERLLVRAHLEAKKCWDLGASEAQMKDILHGIRLGQWRWDYAAASHGGSFHAPVELGRVIAKGIDITQETRIKLARLLLDLGFKGEVPYPNIETKEAAQEFIGLPMEKLHAEKEKFKTELLPQWKKAAEERESKY